MQQTDSTHQSTPNRNKQTATPMHKQKRRRTGRTGTGRDGSNSIEDIYYIMSDKEQPKKITLVMCSCGILVNVIDIVHHEISEEHIVYLYYRENELYKGD